MGKNQFQHSHTLLTVQLGIKGGFLKAQWLPANAQFEQWHLRNVLFMLCITLETLQGYKLSFFPRKTIALFILGATQLLKLFSKYKAELVALSFPTDENL